MQTTEFPVQRVMLGDRRSTDLPESILLLIRDLECIGSGEEAVIPDMFYDTMCKEKVFGQPPKSRWFFKTPDGPRNKLVTLDERLRRIWQRSQQYTREMEHEAGWNNAVHWPLLDEALYDMPGVECRNM
jgi:hypothetical protein